MTETIKSKSWRLKVTHGRNIDMKKALLRYSVILICVVMVVMSVPIVSPKENYAKTDKNTEKAIIVSEQDVKFEIVFDLDTLTISISAVNENGGEVKYSSFNLAVDGRYLYETSLNLSNQEEWNRVINVTNGLNTINRRHVITASTVGSYTEFKFTKEINSSSPGPIPTPYIQDIKVTNGTIDGEPSAVAKVTVANPSIHPYSLKLMVHTLDTDGSFYGASVSPGENRTITVELLDERGSQIAGEARLYAGNLSKGDGAMDQVEFVGRAGEDTKTWNETYGPIKGPWRSDGYEYHNETYEDDESLAERLSGGYEIFGVPIIYAVPVLVVGVVLLRRFG